MEYKVSAIKYRPQKFSEVTSQEFVTQTLMNAKLSNKIAHSYLLSGPRGVGKTTIARIFAKAINCINSKDGEPCNKCENCEEITKGIHPDIFELDAASNRGIDDVRAIQDTAKFYPIKAKYKFFIVDEVHMLTTQAFNAMLKILEEPPEYLIFILATTNPEKLPQTIKSRCQRFHLQRLNVECIFEKLKEVAKNEKYKIENDALFLIAKMGDGSLRDALGVFDMSVSYCGNSISTKELKEFLNIPEKEIYFKISEYISCNSPELLIDYFNKLLETGTDINMLFNGMIEHFRNLLVVKTTNNVNLLEETNDIKNKYSEKSKEFTEEGLSRIIKLLFDSEVILKYSINAKIFFETLLIEICRLKNEISDLSDLISDLNTIKKKTLK
jgi:DNA polymerase-3 subunit gamma/tau